MVRGVGLTIFNLSLLMLRGNPPEDVESDRGTRNKWKSLAEVAERREVEKKATR